MQIIKWVFLGFLGFIMMGCAAPKDVRSPKQQLIAGAKVRPERQNVKGVVTEGLSPVVLENEAVRSTQVGKASWYGGRWHGRRTATGVAFNQESYTAAHPSLPLMSTVRVTNLSNNKEVVLLINDRGPYKGNLILDVSRKAAKSLDMLSNGTATVKVEPLEMSEVIDFKKIKHLPKWKRNQIIAQKIEQINMYNTMRSAG
jgi:rare lipoprotein A (peptidoglycan hydrolase)